MDDYYGEFWTLVIPSSKIFNTYFRRMNLLFTPEYLNFGIGLRKL